MQTATRRISRQIAELLAWLLFEVSLDWAEKKIHQPRQIRQNPL